MNPVFILIVMIGILTSIANKKRQEEMKKKAHQSPNPPQHAPNGQGSPASRQTRPGSATAQKAQRSTRGVDSKWPWPTAEERTQGKGKPANSSGYAGTPRYTHVVTSTLEGGHTHTESSMTGEEDCPPPKVAAVRLTEDGKGSAAPAGNLLGFQPNSVLQGVIYAEILGKPKALQRD